MVDMATHGISLYDTYTRHEMAATKPHNDAYDYAVDAPAKVGIFWHLWPT